MTARISVGGLPIELNVVVSALVDAGFTVIHDSELPEIRLVNGKPRLPALPTGPREVGHAAFYGLEALQKLALARFYEAEDVKKAQNVAAMNLSLVGIDPELPRHVVAARLVADGWVKK